jgi:hypothetical protein
VNRPASIVIACIVGPIHHLATSIREAGEGGAESVRPPIDPMPPLPSVSAPELVNA